MSLPHAKKLRSNSGVQPPENAKRPRRGQALDLSNPPDPLSPKRPVKPTVKQQAILQANTAKKPAKELLRESSPSLIENSLTDKPDPPDSDLVVLFLSPP